MSVWIVREREGNERRRSGVGVSPVGARISTLEGVLSMRNVAGVWSGDKVGWIK